MPAYTVVASRSTRLVQSRRSCHFLESGSLSLPLAAFRRFPCRGVVTPRANLSCCAKKNTTQQGGVLFCIQRFEQGMSEAKKRPSGAFSARLHRRGITIDATCPVPSIVPLPRKRLTFSATGSVSPLSVSRCGNTASESLLLRQIKPPSFDGGFIFTQRSQRTGLFSLYSPSISPAARTALRTHCAQGQRTLPVSTPFKSLQIVAPLFS